MPGQAAGQTTKGIATHRIQPPAPRPQRPRGAADRTSQLLALQSLIGNRATANYVQRHFDGELLNQEWTARARLSRALAIRSGSSMLTGIL